MTRLHVVSAGSRTHWQDVLYSTPAEPREIIASEYRRMIDAGLISERQVLRELAPVCDSCGLSTASHVCVLTCQENRPLRAAPRVRQPYEPIPASELRALRAAA